MGQWTVKEAGSAVRRILMLLAVAALMAAMVAVSAMPAMAKNSFQFGADSPPGPPNISAGPAKNGSSEVSHVGGGACVTHFGDNKFGEKTGGGC